MMTMMTTTETATMTMATHLSQCLLWPALVLRWALLLQPGCQRVNALYRALSPWP